MTKGGSSGSFFNAADDTMIITGNRIGTQPMPDSGRVNTWFNQYGGLWGAIVISLALKIILAGIGQVINPDGVLYIAAAREYALGNFSAGLQIYRMPAFPILMSVVYGVIPDWIVSARIITIASMTLASIPLYGITAILFNRRVAFWAVLFLALAPEANENALRCLRDPTFILLMLSAIYFAIRGLKSRQVRWVFISLFLAGGSLFFRIEGVIVLAAPPLIFPIAALIGSDRAARQFCLKIAVLWIVALLAAGSFLLLVLGTEILSHNRMDELLNELLVVTRFSFFQKYDQIYIFFKEIQDQPPFSGFSHSLVATVRHWIPLIYAVGLLESLIKQLYPLYVLPLLAGFIKSNPLRARWTPEKIFVLLLFFAYILFLYYFLFTRDRVVGRLLFTPALLLYPWVGHGFTTLIGSFDEYKAARLLTSVIVVLFILLPATKSLRAVMQSDRSAFDVGEYIQQNPWLNEEKLLFSDMRHALYSDRLDPFRVIVSTAREIETQIQNRNFTAIESTALMHDADGLVLFINTKKKQAIPKFSYYREHKRLRSRKGVTVIYQVDKHKAAGAAPVATNVAPVASVALRVHPSNPSNASTAFTLSAWASGGSGLYEYQFWLKGPLSGGRWRMVRDYASASSYDWDPNGAHGRYHIQVWARNVGSNAKYEAWQGAALSVPAVGTPAAETP